MTQKSQIGKLGEDIACEYLVKNGYKIIDRNFRRPWGELDIVAKYRDGTLVFVEVKAMRKNSSLNPEDNLTKSKLEKVKRTASIYAGSFENLVMESKGWRVDLVAITLPESLEGKDSKLRHFENI